MKRICMTTALACALPFCACEDSRQEQHEREQAREEMALMRAELEKLKQKEDERTASKAQAKAEVERQIREAVERERKTLEGERERYAPTYNRINRETDLSVDDIVVQLKKYAGLGEMREIIIGKPFVYGEEFLQHYNMMKDGLETIKDYPYLAAVIYMALNDGPPALPKEKYIKTLLDAGASTAGSWNDYTALSSAAKKGAETCVKLLLDAGADPNEEDGNALLRAAQNGHATCVELLLKAGADPSIKENYFGKYYTPLDWAERNGHTDCIELLKK